MYEDALATLRYADVCAYVYVKTCKAIDSVPAAAQVSALEAAELVCFTENC